jgi:hypothetical protein
MTRHEHLGAALGAPAQDPTRAVTALRAMASRHGIDLAPVTDTDAAAAVVAVELWSIVTGLSPLSEAHLADPEAIRSLSRIIARAAGSPAPCPAVATSPGPVPDDDIITTIDEVLDWLAHRPDQDEVISRAAHDLRGHQELEAAGRALEHHRA